MEMPLHEPGAETPGSAAPANIYHAAAGRLLEEVMSGGLHGNERMRGNMRERLIEYTVGVRAFFARAEARGEVASEVRALKAELRESMKGKTAAEVLRAMGELDDEALARVDRSERKVRAAAIAELTSAACGGSNLLAAAGAAWHEMDAFIRGA